jgi:hypothetical protein
MRVGYSGLENHRRLLTSQTGEKVVLGLIFSYNRALQLDGTLRSLLKHCRDVESLNLFVLYLTSSPLHARLYIQLKQEYAIWPQIVFIEQRNFRRDVLELLYQPTYEKQADIIRRWLISMGWRFGFINNLWKKSEALENTILFLVDDNIFVKDFLLQDAIHGLEQIPDALGFSLRLGTNTTYCYTFDKPQLLPVFEHTSFSTSKSHSRQNDLPAILKFDWTVGEADFGYPLEVSSSIFRLDDVRPVINNLPFQNPNFLESRLSQQVDRFRNLKPYLLCYDRSVTFCNPINKVQKLHQNRAGVKIGYSVEELAWKFEMGERFKVTEYDGFVPTGCHQEVEMVFENKVLYEI